MSLKHGPYLEGALERICWLTADLQQEALGQALTTHMTHRSRYDAALALVHARFPNSTAYRSLKALQNKVTSELPGKRNDIVHSRLHGLVNVKRPFRVVYKARGSVKKDTIKVDIEEYEIVARDVLSTTNEIIDILNQLVEMIRATSGAVPPWTERP